MKVDLLKTIIKKAVKEAVREEIQQILTESAKSKPDSTTVFVDSVASTGTEGFKNLNTSVTSYNPLTDMLKMTQQSMTKEDFENVMGGQSIQRLNEGSFTSNMESTSISSSPQSGIDISKLDFVSKAAAIYKKSIEKDKVKVGG